jgi:hypothetical protein
VRALRECYREHSDERNHLRHNAADGRMEGVTDHMMEDLLGLAAFA